MILGPQSQAIREFWSKSQKYENFFESLTSDFQVLNHTILAKNLTFRFFLFLVKSRMFTHVVCRLKYTLGRSKSMQLVLGSISIRIV